jgi:hypothetical protein
MSMATNPENFDRLLKLLALKKHEQPPPGYFDHLSREVIIQLRQRTGVRESWLDELGAEASWFWKVWAVLEAKPIFAGLFGVAVSGLLLAGIIYSQRLELPSSAEAVSAPEKVALGNPHAGVEADQPAAVLLASSTNPVVDLGALEGLFDGTRLKAQPVSLKLDDK